ncbi:branched-chain-amino-acid aminotransferase-like protein 1 [Patiria miniata]|uniref:Sulfotransferase family protein n=1 Tax=Patiria miniata TaxID=46514 RepID=A0A913Z656_PATMI|nr:branched-chain-amino-acid aminotransferase-like protein 1 [Patiria miniata]
MATSETTPSFETSETTPSSEQQVRLLIWTIARSTSTVLSKCLSFVENTKVFFEICENGLMIPEAATEGGQLNISVAEQKVCNFMKKAYELTNVSAGLDASQCTLPMFKKQLEEAHTGKKFIFCKDMAYAISDHLEFLPKGFRHLFLIRHPLRVFPSWKKIYLQMTDMSPEDFHLDDLPPNLFPKGFGYREMNELFEHVMKEEHDQEAIIVDADDLLQDPKGILSALFKDIGLPFDETVLHWEAGDAVSEQWTIPRAFLQGNKLVGFYQNALDSTCFLKPKPLPDRSSISPDLFRFVDASMPYYQKMYSKRLTV